MNKFLSVLFLTSSLSTMAMPAEKFVTIDKKVYEAIANDLPFSVKPLALSQKTAVLKLNMNQVEETSHKIHGKLKRCGGFMAHDTLAEAKAELVPKKQLISALNLFDYSIDQQNLASNIVEQVSETEIRSMILSLTKFGSRHYLSESGSQSSHFILETWSKIAAHRSDVKVELIQHEQWPQPSILLTIEGSDLPEEIVVLGGHADSISMDGDEAPGADDNASGVSSITEVIRLLMVNNFKPKRTLQFMAYAAEEVGLLGSREIAKKYRKEKKKVVGVLQLDMTLFKGTSDKDIVLISDYTNRSQNEFLGKLIDEYVKVPWGFSRCGYGCSDHASWSMMGYPASFPFESRMEDHNPVIHTKDDTLESVGGTADHAVKFSKLATAFVIEMAN